ncbi:hypothetical protein SK3146_05683 [Paenibacillus konkukensis]|uniref:Uncharacterized protein n=1 Tax=Paenibacillus konkukensis TaxID=2020716 RepID=A0ABY4RX87_9BACL|nr:hypothetical protein SK3146_05683 [Paenibacillus konkukensis]
MISLFNFEKEVFIPLILEPAAFSYTCKQETSDFVN